MEMVSTKSQLEMARNVHDLGSIDKMREAIASGDDKVLKEAAQQFEAIFVQMMLKSMRKAEDALADKDSPFNSEQVKFYRDMYDQQLAQDLSSGGGLGLADVIVQQLSHNNDKFTPASVIRNDGNLSSLNRHAREQITEAQDSVLNSNSKGTVAAYKAAMFSDQNAFIEALYPHAEKAAKALGVEPKAIIAQAAVETGWGQFVIHSGDGKSSNNLFGIKANRQWQGEQAVVDTLEFNGAVPSKQKAAFRAYNDLGQAMDDYVNFISSQPRYQDAVKNSGDTQAYFQSLQSAGYATDPEYANKVMAVYHSDALKGYLP